MPTGFVYDERFLDHKTGDGHPERPERVTAVMRNLAQSPLTSKLTHLPTRIASRNELEAVHESDYITRVRTTCESGAPYLDSMDVAISKRSFDVALLAAGAPLVLADAIIDRQISNGFALVRPPGHHAESDAALGFCLFNNVAVLARYLQTHHGIDKIAIIDWDVHHGNGTQHAFESDPSVMYVSTHQYPYYPGTGAASETGVGAGAGSIVNCPMRAGATDDLYELAFRQRILPAITHFAPEFIIISAGFDAHRNDPLAEINLTTEAFQWMSRRLLEAADQSAGGRVISVLEGGYHLTRLGECVAVHLDELVSANLDVTRPTVR